MYTVYVYITIIIYVYKYIHVFIGDIAQIRTFPEQVFSLSTVVGFKQRRVSIAEF